MPDQLARSLEQSRANCSDMEFLVADDEYVRDQIHAEYPPAIAKLYDRIRIPSARADLARMILLYHTGGVYMDASFRVRKPVSELIQGEVDHVFVQRDDNHAARRAPQQAALINGFIAAAPRSPLIRRCIDRIINNLIDGDLNKRLVHAMGAGVLTSVVDGIVDQSGIRFVGMQTLRQHYVDHLRVKGHANTWVAQQADGIIDADYLKQHSGKVERRWSLGSSLFHIRISRLKL